jgi:acyl-CoA thioester hydrolase
MEQAEHSFFRSLGLQIHGALPDGTVFGWPRVSATCAFNSPAFYGDMIDVRMTVIRLTRRSLTVKYEMVRGETALAVGEMKSAFCIIPTGAKLQSAEMPEDYFERLTMKFEVPT